MKADIYTDTDECGQVARLIKITLDEKGPMPFASLHLECNLKRSIKPYALHDLLNAMIQTGSLNLAPTGFYLLP